ncbi:MAG: hypothetical protein IPK52_21240 [Chloroflexi bacterium]|nr:hypothetical protein [Chloroflexota bacterium]
MKRGYDNPFRLRVLQFILVTLVFSMLTSSSTESIAQSGGALVTAPESTAPSQARPRM